MAIASDCRASAQRMTIWFTKKMRGDEPRIFLWWGGVGVTRDFGGLLGAELKLLTGGSGEGPVRAKKIKN